jgi:hypothetical protein
MKCWFDGSLQLRKGEILRIRKAYEEDYDGHPLRVTLMDIVTTGTRCYSPFDTNRLSEPILGRVIGSTVRVGTKTTFFEIEEGHFEDYVFVKAGEVKKGQDALKEIFANRIDEYVKIWDPYISPDTIRLVSHIRNSKTVLILTDTIYQIGNIKIEANRLSGKIIIKKRANLYHDRWILTKGEGWSVGSTLKDFGKKASNLTKLASSVEAETSFDENWGQSVTVFEKN